MGSHTVNVCGQPYSLQIRSQVSNVGHRVPASSSRSLTVRPAALRDGS
jgi:hypothetical protein